MSPPVPPPPGAAAPHVLTTAAATSTTATSVASSSTLQNSNNSISNISHAKVAATRDMQQQQLDFIANYFKNLNALQHQQQLPQQQQHQQLQQQQQQQQQREHVVTAVRQQVAVTAAATTTLANATTVTSTTATMPCDSSSSSTSNNSNSLSCSADEIKQECEQHAAATTEPAAADVVIKTEEDAAAQDNESQQQQTEQASPTSTTSSSTLLSSSSSATAAIATATTTSTSALHASDEKENEPAPCNNSNDDSYIFAKPRPILLDAVNPHIICNLCHGYLIDATTIVECLHSFCHSCIMKHLRTEQYCPRCEMMINTAKPNIKPDTTLQAIVYKLVPGLYEKELMKKRAFYKDIPEQAALATPEQRGDDTEHLIFSPSEDMSLSLEYADIEEHMGNASEKEFLELLKPKFLQCPSVCTVAHLKKFVYGKFDIDINQFNIDIMYKVKTIVLLDHYTLMDVAYIYTWKRDAPMRFYFRVKESNRRVVKPRKVCTMIVAKEEVVSDHETPRLSPDAMTVIHQATPSLEEPELPLAEIKVEDEAEVDSTTSHVTETKTFEIVPQPQQNSASGSKQELSKTDKLKITIVTKGSRDKHTNSEIKSSSKSYKEKKEAAAAAEFKEERKVENIKLKIDLSKQNSVTIINMSDPERKEIVKPVKPEKEWKVKTKREKSDSPKSSPNSERKRKTPSPLTVPPLTIKAERISPLAKIHSPKEPSLKQGSTSTTAVTADDDQKSQFLKAFALKPIKDFKAESTEKSSTLPKTLPPKAMPNIASVLSTPPTLMKPPNSVLSKLSLGSKRKSKDPVKAIPKKPKFAVPTFSDDFKIKLPSPTANLPSKSPKPQSVPASPKHTSTDKPHMPPPAPLALMKPPSALPKKLNKPQHKFAPPGSLTPHPMQGIQPSAPGNRTPIAKRYQPILPKASRPNPFANIPNDVNKILKDAGTEIKSISSAEPTPSPKLVYGPKTPNHHSMCPPPSPMHPSSSPSSSPMGSRNMQSPNTSKSNGSNNYLNMALFNSAKSKGNEVPPGCRTPMYTPNSPSYSPSSPQYAPNYNIPTMPTYKYTPKPSNATSNYLQSVLGNNSPMSSLFPAPPTKKTSSVENTNAQRSNSPMKTEQPAAPKRVYPFAKSPSPIEDPPEKQLKVKSLLTSCNINIPSSLSITITREDSESQANNAQYPKHKSPVNNYIEILKLPDQSVETTDSSNKRASSLNQQQPPTTSLAPPPPKKEHNNAHLQLPPMIPLPHKPTPSNSQLKNMNLNYSKPSVTIHNVNPTNTISKSTPPSNTKVTKTTQMNTTPASATSTAQNVAKPQMPPPMSNAMKPPMKLTDFVASVDKKTPSPEKRSAPSAEQLGNSPTSGQSESKSPKSPTSESAAAKKFRPILPRQNLTGITEVIPPKVSHGNIIGTYSSPGGVAVKVHSNKKVPPSKKSPGISHVQQNGGGATSKIATPKSSPNGAMGAVKPSHTASPKTSPNTPPLHNSNTNAMSKSKKSTAASPSAATNQLVSHSTNNNPHHQQSPQQHHNNKLAQLSAMNPLPGMHPMPSMVGMPNMPPHLGSAAAAAAASQAEMRLRAQVQAHAAANQSNMFYNYANAAAQMGQFAPSIYNYQQAYIMEQLSRMQRAGNDAIVEYMQKLKNGGATDKMPAIGDGSEFRHLSAAPTASSPKTSPAAAAANSNGQPSPKLQQSAAKTK